MATRFGLFVFILLITSALSGDEHRQFIVWNVGQGQWATLMTERACWHFDAGGEHAPWSALRRACRSKQNYVSLSHWDWDHLSFVRKLARSFPNACLTAPPPGEAAEARRRLVAALPKCRAPLPFPSWSQPGAARENDRSRVVLADNILIPGDSTGAAEKIWTREIAGLARTRLLVLGHHGSQSSTSLRLLARLPHLQMAVSSARRLKYGHPHARVVHDLNRAHVALLRTEEWNSIYFELD